MAWQLPKTCHADPWALVTFRFHFLARLRLFGKVLDQRAPRSLARSEPEAAAQTAHRASARRLPSETC